VVVVAHALVAFANISGFSGEGDSVSAVVHGWGVYDQAFAMSPCAIKVVVPAGGRPFVKNVEIRETVDRVFAAP
jgi:hypothetical protein